MSMQVKTEGTTTKV